MDTVKKKKWKRRLIIFFSVFIICLISVRIQSLYVRKEFEGLKDIAYLLNQDFEYKEYNLLILDGFGFGKVTHYDNDNYEDVYNEYDDYYVVTPFGRFFWEWIGFNHLSNEELGFPRRIWNDIHSVGIFFYPTKEIELQPEDRNLTSYERSLSFNKRCSVSEVEKELDFDTIEYLWVDTYGETDISQFEYFTGAADKENCAYAIPCRGYNSFYSAAEHFVDVLNKYKDKQYLKTGKYLHKVKTGIKKQGEITVDDLVIIGAEPYYKLRSEESSIIRDVEAELNGEEESDNAK